MFRLIEFHSMKLKNVVFLTINGEDVIRIMEIIGGSEDSKSWKTGFYNIAQTY